MAFKSTLGVQVDRAASILPQTVGSPGTPYFTVAGGKVLVKGLVGEIVVANVGGVVSANWFFAPSGAIGTGANLCAATVLTTWVIGDILTLSGLLTDAMLPAVHASSAPMLTVAGQGIVLMPGAMGVITTASFAGQWRWVLWYIPIDAGATVVAV